MFSFANVLDLFANEFTGLRARGFAFSLVAPGTLNRFFFRHRFLRRLCVQERRLGSMLHFFAFGLRFGFT
jgi:hypothetical protein